MFEVHQIKKIYANGKGISSFSFTMSAPGITAVVGPNGAGKSTLFNIIMGITRPDSGTIQMNDMDISAIPLCNLSFLPQRDYLIEDFTVQQMMDYMVLAKKITSYSISVDSLLDGFSLKPYLKARIKDLSGGLRKRVSILCAIIGTPGLVVLDEPLNELDIQSVIYLKKVLRTLSEQGAYILVSSHVLDFLDGLADRIVFLNVGEIVYECSPQGQNMKTEEVYKKIYNIQ